MQLKVAPTKLEGRAKEKERTSPEAEQIGKKELEGPACAWIFDLERASLLGSNAKSLVRGIELLKGLQGQKAQHRPGMF